MTLAAGACATNKTKECFADGELYYCEADKECGGLQRLCVDPGGCGNGITEGSEECDDGNVRAGDGCSPTCRTEACGNGIVDPGETCDDGNRIDSDSCTNDCASTNACGNGITDAAVGEECDDHNTLAGDGCGPTCRFEHCGNHINDPGEECDDGNLVAGDGCSPSCFFERCGNHRLDPGEYCDDGDQDNNNECNNDCTSDNRCGNHITDRNKGEVCDEGGVETENCSADCHSQRQCGDGIIDPAAGEECDDGVDHNQDDLDCRHDCILNRCGDSFVNKHGTHHEDCDGGPAPTSADPRAATPTETALCNSDCTNAGCDDHKVNRTAGEECDDGAGNNANDKDCTAGCKVNVCGDHLANTSGPNHREACDDGNRVDGDACTNQCTLPSCGDGVLEGNEQCDDHNHANNDGCSATCRFELCGDGIKNGAEDCDFAIDRASCNLDCTASHCGDGQLNTFATPPEQCEDGNTIDGDGCSHDCQFEHCGNGVVDPLEECDHAAGLQPCSASCRQEICGNGILDLDPNAVPPIAEQCDLGAGHNSDTGACLSTCQLARCGDGQTEAGVEQCDDGDDGNGNDRDCTSACQRNVCGDHLIDSAGTQVEDCDDGSDNTDDAICPYNESCAARCSTTCHVLTMVVPSCGDGTISGPERCDDHNVDGCGSCSADCTRVTAQRAIGFLLAVSGAQLNTDDSFTLDDGINPPVVFRFEEGDVVPTPSPPPVPGVVTITFFNTDTMPTVQLKIQDAIVAAHDTQPLLIQVDLIDPVSIRLIHDRPTTRGNRPITEQVGDPTFFAVGMVTGAGGDCPQTIGCASDDDCLSHTCTAHVCQP